ncbi:MAG: ribosome biogenesis GTPase YlqF, partial [Clostridiaceae bacterium]|nr:ribosome biogenesis GTPase YlqF [Clostridiaceae bacterium]
HMAKTKKQIIEDLKLIDVVIEIVDARIPKSSRNPDIAEWTKNKKKIVILNKFDLAEDEENQKWISYFKKQGIASVLTDSNTGKGIPETIKEIEKVAKEDQTYFEEKGRIGKSIRVMIVGIPNVGKSSFINRITKKSSAIVGNRPGVTRQKQWVRVKENIELLDTPGILWPKLEQEETAINLAYTGTIKDNNLEMTEIAYYLLKYLLENKKERLVERYSLPSEEVEETLKNTDRLENENILEILYMIGKKRGAIISGGRIDEEKASNILIDDFRSGKLGKITLEKVR